MNAVAELSWSGGCKTSTHTLRVLSRNTQACRGAHVFVFFLGGGGEGGAKYIFMSRVGVEVSFPC